MEALEKVLLAAGKPSATVQAEEDPAADLVAAATGLLDELLLLLASGDNSKGKGDDDDTPPWMQKKGAKGAKGKKKPKGKGSSDDDDDDDDEDADDDAEDKAEVKKKIKATALAAAARIALAGLDSRAADYDWVEATSAPLSAAESLRLASGDDNAAPYGDVEYADPGYRGKKRYPIDAKHIHAALSYFSKAKNRAAYTADQVKHIWGKIKSAAKKHGVEMSPDTAAASASMISMDSLIALAAMPSDGGVPMQHPPFTGTHNHPHSVSNVHSHSHMHNNDSHHPCGNGAMY